MKKFKLLLITSLISTVASYALDKSLQPDEFLAWLKAHTQEFAECTPTKKDADYILCDSTRVSQEELKNLFSKTSDEVLAALKAKGITVELVCAEGEQSRFKSDCSAKSKNIMFNEISSLHGKYLPEEKKILIRNTASAGSLIHEYIHYLESENINLIYEKIYKKTRNQIQAQLINQMDIEIPIIQKLEKSGKKNEIPAHLAKFMAANDALRGFAFYQDLIDERNIFILYLKYGHEFGAKDEDLALAKKNMGFICKNPKIASVLPKAQCDLRNPN